MRQTQIIPLMQQFMDYAQMPVTVREVQEEKQADPGRKRLVNQRQELRRLNKAHKNAKDLHEIFARALRSTELRLQSNDMLVDAGKIITYLSHLIAIAVGIGLGAVLL